MNKEKINEIIKVFEEHEYEVSYRESLSKLSITYQNKEFAHVVIKGDFNSKIEFLINTIGTKIDGKEDVERYIDDLGEAKELIEKLECIIEN